MLHVPTVSIDVYKITNPWRDFKAIVGLPEELIWDVNGDGAVDVADISSVIRVMAQGDSDVSADVNRDGAIDVADISAIITKMAGK